MIKKNYLNLIIKIFFNFTSLIICAALASFLASMIFIFAVGLIKYGDIINWSQFNWGQIIIVGIGGSVMGPVLASPFLCFFMMPWIFFMQSKKITNFFLTVLVPAIFSMAYGYFVGGLSGWAGELGSPIECAILFGFAGFLTALFLWVLKFRSFKGVCNAENQ